MLAHVCEIFASASIFPKMGCFSALQLLDIIPMTPFIHHLRDMALNYRFVSSSDVLAAASNTGCKYLLNFSFKSGILGHSPLCFSLGCLRTVESSGKASSQKWIGAVELKCSRSHLGVVKAPEDLQNTHRCLCNPGCASASPGDSPAGTGTGTGRAGLCQVRAALAAILQAQQFSLT